MAIASGRPIGVGIIGANPDRGWALNAHIPAITALEPFRLAAVSTSRPESASAAAAKFGVPAFADAAELARHPDVDLVAITVKVPEHRQLAEIAIAAGKHVYCEWPLGNGLAEAEEIAARADSAGVMGFVGLQARFNPVVRQVAQLLADGYVGTVLSTSIIGSGGGWGAKYDRFSVYLSDRRNGATMLSIPMGHTLDAVCRTLGEFTTLSALRTIRRRDIAIGDGGEAAISTSPDQVIVAGMLHDEVPIAVHYRGGMNRGTNFLWEINGTEGDLQVGAPSGHLQMMPATLRGVRGSGPMQDIAIAPEHRWVPDGLTPSAFGVAQAYAHVAKALHGEPNEAATFRDGVARHHMLDAIEKAADTGHAQRL